MNDSFCLKTLKKAGSVKKIICSVMVFTFLTSLIAAPAGAQLLPVPGTPVALSAGFQPPVLLGLKIHPENPLLFDFIVDQGALKLSDDELKLETEKLVKYFLAALTIPDKEVWVNLSPYEKDKIVPDALGQTAMGKAMLEQDYLLKQLASSLTNPDEKLGREFWANVKNQVQAQLNTKDIPMSTFNKVWIVPQKAEVLESQGIVLVGEKRLKVMMDQDYLAMEKNEQGESVKAKDVSTISTGIFKDTVLPSIEKEINEGKNFADVRQIYNSVILATWYKKALKESLLGKVYADKSKVAGVETDDKDMKQKIYEQYLAAFKKGVYNLIKEESDSAGDMIPRKYFSGGIKIANFTASSSLLTRPVSLAQAGQVIENAGSKAVRVQMAEPKTDEGSAIASSALFSSSTELIPASALSGADTLSGLLKLFNQRGIRYQELYDYLSPLFARLRTQQQPMTQDAIQIYINEQTISGRTAIKELGVSKSQVVTETFNEWMLDIERSHPNFLNKSEPLTWLLAAVLEELKTPQGLRGHYLTDGAHLYVPLVDQRMTEVVFGNDKVNVLYSEGKLILSEGVIGSQTSARYIGEKDEYVYIGRDVSADHIAKLPLKNANLTVSQTHFSVRLRDMAGAPYLEIIDGDALKLTGSTNGTLVLNRAVAAGEFRLISGAVIGRPIQTPKMAELGINTTARQLEASGTFAQRIIVTSAYLPIDIGVTNGKLWLRVDGTSPEFSNDSVTRFLEFGRPYVVNRFDPNAPLDVAVNKLDLKVSGQSGISRAGNFEITVVRNGRYFDFTVKDLQTQNITRVDWVDIKASSSVNSDDVLAAMQIEVAALGIDAVKGTGNIHSYTSVDGLDFVVRLFRDKVGKDFTVFEIFRNENEVTNYAILEGNFINLSAEELWSKYLGTPAASSVVTEGDVESAFQAKIESMGLNSAGEDPAVYKSFSVGSGEQEIRYNVRLYYSGNESPYTVIRRYQVVNAVAKLSEFSLLSGNFIELDAVQLRGLHETYQSNSVSSAIIMDSGKSFEGKLEVQFQRDDEGVILTDGKLVPGDEINNNKQYMRAYRVNTFDYGRRVKIMSGRYYSGENIFDMTGGGGAYEAEYLGLPRDPVVDSVTLKAQAINFPFGLEVTVSKGDAKSFNYQASMTAPPAADAQIASAPTVDANKFTKGGIDFDPTTMNLQIKRDGRGVPLPLPQQNLEQINIQGLVPIIINIVPINSQTLPIFLGQAEKEPGREPEKAMNAAS